MLFKYLHAERVGLPTSFKCLNSIDTHGVFPIHKDELKTPSGNMIK